MRRLSSAVCACALLVFCLAVPATTFATPRSWVGVTVSPDSAVTRSPGSGIGSPLLLRDAGLASLRFGSSLVKPAVMGASVAALEPGRVGLPWRDSNYFWSGPYLHICGAIYNPYDYPVSDIRCVFTASVNGVQVLNETNYAAAYVLYNEEDASLGGTFYLPEYAGQTLSSCIVSKSGVAYGGSPTVLLTDTRYARVVAPTGERTYSIVFRNDSSGYVARPVMGGYEFDANYKMIDTMFGYSDVLIPPGGSVTMTGIAFYPRFTPTDYDYYAEAVPVTVHNVSVFVGPGGSATPSGTMVVEDGTDTTITITPNAGFGVSDVLVDGASVGPVTRYVLSNVTADRAVVVTFKSLPKAKMYTPVALTTMRYKRAASIYGYIAPAHAPGGTLVTLQFYLRNSKGSYVYHHSVSAKGYYYSASKSKYVAKVALPHRGRWRVRAYHADATHNPSFSAYDYITVR